MNMLEATVLREEELGSEVLVPFSVQARAAVSDEVRELAADVGDDRRIKQLGSLEPTTLVGRLGPQTRIQKGDTIEVAIDEGALHFFDACTGAVIYDKAPLERPNDVAARDLANVGDNAGA